METKKCVKCNKIKNVNKFHTKGKENRRNSWCKICVYECQKNRWKDRKRKAVELSGGKCQDCGYNKNLSVFDFHHLDPSKKEFGWGKLRQRKWSDIIKELKKCILLCANCHRERHNPEDTLITTQNCHNNLLNISLINKNSDEISTYYSSLKPTGKCPSCNSDVYGTKYCCVDCVSKDRRKVKNRPSKTKLMKMIKESNYCAIGREYGVSDNAVRKWAKVYNLI